MLALYKVLESIGLALGVGRCRSYNELEDYHLAPLLKTIVGCLWQLHILAIIKQKRDEFLLA